MTYTLACLTGLTVTLPLPPRELSPNFTVGSRGGRMGKAAKIKKYRHCAYTMAQSAIGRKMAPRWEAATAQATFYVKDKRRRDADNALASLKAAFDGLKDAGVVADDSGITHLPVRFVVDRANPRVEIRLEGGERSRAMAKREKVLECETWVPLRKDGSVRLSDVYSNRRRKPPIWDGEVDRFVWGRCTIRITEIKPKPKGGRRGKAK